jgi:hypothetical protein
MVGIGGDVPRKGVEIRLGDVVVSVSSGTSGGVIQYDYGKTINNGCLGALDHSTCLPNSF